MRKLDGRTAIVAGASGGLGNAIAIAFAQAGATIILVGRNKAVLDEVARSCRKVGAVVATKTADVASWDDVEMVVLEAERDLGAVDVLVNATGVVGPIGLVQEIDPIEWANAVQVNLVGAFHLSRAVIPKMIQRRRGKIILLSGGGATAPFPRFTAYAAAKAGVVRLAETLAEEVKEFNVQVNTIAPGFVDTRMQDAVLAAGQDAGAQFQRAKEARETGAGAVAAELAAELVVFLASEDSGALTGKLISAQHDPWRGWAGRGDELNASPLFTLRRLDPFTLATVGEASV